MGSYQNRFPLQERWKKWVGCWGGLSCFGAQRGGKRIVPASRAPEGSSSVNQSNGPQAAGLPNQATSLAPSLLAPPSSPASFSNSALPSTAQSPNCLTSLSANSPGGPSSTMYATGPYAHETQLVSPPVFSTFTTEPSTAPLTPPPELAHLTTPSSPDVPYAHFLSSALDLKGSGRACVPTNDLQLTYPLSPGSPPSSIISPASKTSGNCLSSSFPERDFSSHWDALFPAECTKLPTTGSEALNTSASMSRDSNFFCPETFAQFYSDQPFPHSGGRLSISKDSDIHFNGGNLQQSRQNKNTKQDVEEMEAYRASFGFSADEMITTPQYVELTDVMDDSFSMIPPIPSKSCTEDSRLAEWEQSKSVAEGGLESKQTKEEAAGHVATVKGSELAGENASGCGNRAVSGEDDIFSNLGESGAKKRHAVGLSYSDAEVDYRRGRSLRQGRGDVG